jgi:hypothetical protein
MTPSSQGIESPAIPGRFKPPIIKVQVKSTEGSVGDPVVSALYGKVGPSEFGLLVTLGTFSTQARAFAREKPNLRLIDGEELVDLVFEHYGRFDAKYKGLLPLKQVYVPEPFSSSDGEGYPCVYARAGSEIGGHDMDLASQGTGFGVNSARCKARIGIGSPDPVWSWRSRRRSSTGRPTISSGL